MGFDQIFTILSKFHNTGIPGILGIPGVRAVSQFLRFCNLISIPWMLLSYVEEVEKSEHLIWPSIWLELSCDYFVVWFSHLWVGWSESHTEARGNICRHWLRCNNQTSTERFILLKKKFNVVVVVAVVVVVVVVL